MTALEWRDNGWSTTDDRFRVNSENVRGEGPYYYLMMNYNDAQIAKQLGVVTGFYGRPKRNIPRLQRIAQRIADAV